MSISEINENGLPRGWEFVTVGDVAEYINGMAFKPTDWEKEGLPIIRIQNLTNSCYADRKGRNLNGIK